MKKINNLFSLNALASKVALNKVEMQALKGGFSCYCNGTKVSVSDVSGCISMGCTLVM